MTIEEMNRIRQELGYTYEVVSALSKVPLGTVQKVLGGITKHPRQQTIEALTAVFERGRRMPFEAIDFFTSPPVPGPEYDRPSAYGSLKEHAASLLREAPASYGTPADARHYNIQDIYALPDGIRAELIDGMLYYFGSPTRTHQKIAGEMYLSVANYIKAHNGSCEVYIPPFGVFLFGDDSTYLEPDLIVVCDTNKLTERGCIGAPDWVVEVLSPSTALKDQAIKLPKYRLAGVKECWLIDPRKEVVMTFVFEKEKEAAGIYGFEEVIPCFLYPDLKIRIADMLTLQ